MGAESVDDGCAIGTIDTRVGDRVGCRDCRHIKLIAVGGAARRARRRDVVGRVNAEGRRRVDGADRVATRGEHCEQTVGCMHRHGTRQWRQLLDGQRGSGGRRRRRGARGGEREVNAHVLRSTGGRLLAVCRCLLHADERRAALRAIERRAIVYADRVVVFVGSTAQLELLMNIVGFGSAVFGDNSNSMGFCN